jgi:pimeloyl-ACP methyl ester carboxylesterase
VPLTTLRAAGRGRLDRLRLAMAAPRTAYGFRSEWTTVGGTRMHARVPTGSARGGPPVVLVHGLAVSHRYLMPTAVLLARSCDVRVVDLPGFGLSGNPGRTLDTGEQADALAGWLAATGTGPAVLLGNSFGCQVAVRLAVEHPDQCLGLVLSGPTVDPARRSAAGQIGRWLRDALREDPFQAAILLRDVADAGPVRVWRTLRAAVRDRIEEGLPQVDVPVLVLRGGAEPIVPARWAAEAASRVRDGELVELPGSPHNSVYVAAELLVAAVLPFLARLPRREARALDGTARPAEAAR